MYIKRTLLISFLLHSLVFCAATLSVTHLPPKERILMVKIEAGQDVRPPPGRAERGAAGRAAKEERKNLQRPGSLRRPGDQVNPPSEGRRDLAAVRNTQQNEETVEQPSAALAVQVKSMASDREQGLPSTASEGHSGSGDGGREKDGTGVSLYNKAGDSGASRGSEGGNEDYIRRIQELIERTKIYPPLARKRKQEGTVIVQFAIDTKGLPRDVRIIRSAGFTLLDSAARDIITKAAPFPHVKGAIEVPITFRLQDKNGQ